MQQVRSHVRELIKEKALTPENLQRIRRIIVNINPQQVLTGKDPLM